MLHNSEKQATSLQKVFTFNGATDIQVVMINNEPHFVAQDVCSALQLQNPTDILQKTLEKEEYLPYTVYRVGQQRTVNVVNESGLYALIFQSRKPIAKVFRRWVTSEVLPAIRKTGSYSVPKCEFDAKFYQLQYKHIESAFSSLTNANVTLVDQNSKLIELLERLNSLCHEPA